MEKNNHEQGGRWSERQLGVYHSFSPFTASPSVLVLLHALHRSHAQDRLEQIFADGLYQGTTPTSPLLLHVLLLYTYFDNWRWYMDDLGSTCLRLVANVNPEANRNRLTRNRRTKASPQI